MPNNRLILRKLQSPWVTPITDITKGSVLTHDDVDNNFIYLRGETIYSADTVDGNLRLHKINGQSITFSGDGSGATQNNLVDAIEVTLNTPFDGTYTISEAVNAHPTFTVDEQTNLLVRTFTAPSRGGSEYKYGYWLLAVGLGTYGSGGTALTDNDFEFIGEDVEPITVSEPTLYNPEAIVYDITGFTGTTIEEAVNTSLDTYVIDNDDDVYFRLEIGGAQYVYRWIDAQPITIGNSGSTTDADDYLEFYYQYATNTGYWTGGTTGSTFSIKAINDSGLEASGDYSVAQNHSTLASGYASTAEGFNTTASGNFSHAEGSSSQATGATSHAQGSNNIAGGINSHAGGLNNTVLAAQGFVHSNSSTLDLGATNSAIIGGYSISGISANTVYVPSLNIDTQPNNDSTLNTVLGRAANGEVKEINVTDLDIAFSGTYAQLNTLVTNNQLIVGNTYIMTDYVTKYKINASDSSDIKLFYEVIGAASGYAQFASPGIPDDVLVNGETAIVDSLPGGYAGTLTVGQVLTVTDHFSALYIKFSGYNFVAGDAGVVLRYEKQRYPNVATDATILDISGKTVMQPGGVLNTEVHDDGAYMNMTAAENPSPKMEVIALKAIDTNKFSKFAESVTYPNDELEYDFNDTKIYDDNGFELTGVTRNGFITRRTNEPLNISVDKDWRVQRYRRFEMDNANWTEYTYRGTGSTVYEVGGINYCTYVNGSITTDHRHVMLLPSKADFYFDFNKMNADPFVSGTTSPLSTVHRITTNDGRNVNLDIELPASGLTGTTLAKDIHIIPISGEAPTSLVKEFRVRNLENTVFRDLSQRYGASSNIDVNSSDSILDSTFMSGVRIFATSSIDNATVLDYLELTNFNSCSGLRWFAYGNMENSGKINNMVVAGRTNDPSNNFTNIKLNATCNIAYSMFGGRRQDNLILDDFQCGDSLFMIPNGEGMSMRGATYLTKVDGNMGGFATYLGLKLDLSTINSTKPSTGLYGFYYNLPGVYSDVRFDNLNANKAILHSSIDTNNNITLITIANPQ